MVDMHRYTYMSWYTSYTYICLIHPLITRGLHPVSSRHILHTNFTLVIDQPLASIPVRDDPLGSLRDEPLHPRKWVVARLIMATSAMIGGTTICGNLLILIFPVCASHNSPRWLNYLWLTSFVWIGQVEVWQTIFGDARPALYSISSV